MLTVRFAQSARKHRIGRAHALYVMNTYEPISEGPGKNHGELLRNWLGMDERGVELEITAVITPGLVLVIHVMPADYRRKTPLHAVPSPPQI